MCAAAVTLAHAVAQQSWWWGSKIQGVHSRTYSSGLSKVVSIDSTGRQSGIRLFMTVVRDERAAGQLGS